MAEPLCESVCGIVLAGGKGRRIGGRKAFIRLGGETLIERVCNTLKGVFSEVVIVADEVSPFSPLSYQVIPDRLSALGPMGGLETALRAVSEKHLFVVACDMPKLNPKVIRVMLSFFDAYDLVIPRISGRLHPLHAIYAPACLPVIEKRIQEKNFSLSALPEHLNSLFFQEAKFRKLDPQLQSLMNINTPEDLAFAGGIEAQ